MKLCLIPARGGSKRIARKNIKPFYGQPMIAYPIKAAQASGLFDQVVVSTDDDEIAQISRNYHAQVPFMRPAELADDHTATRPVLLHALEWFAQQGLVISELTCIYPCSPFISEGLLHQAYKAWQDSDADYCMSVCAFPSAPQRALIQNEQGRVSSLMPQFRSARTQDLAPAFYDAGMFYFCRPDALRAQTAIHSTASYPFVLPSHLAHDIDTLEDWRRAERFYEVEHSCN